MSILSVRDFAHRVRTPADRLYEIASHIDDYYREWPQQDKKNPAKFRTIREPLPELKALHRRIVKAVLEPLGISDVAHGGVRDRSPRTNAELHLGQDCVVTLDVRQFFPNARHYVIYRMLVQEYGFGRDVASLITRLCTFDAGLPQGAPPSTAIANLMMAAPVDIPLTHAARRIGVVNSRFVDDIALSGRDPRALINLTGRLLSRRRLPMWRKKAKFQTKLKLKIMPRSTPQEVTGLLVNSKNGLSLSRRKRDAVKAAIFQAAGIAEPSAREAAVRSIRGRIAYVARFNPGNARRLQGYLDKLTRGLSVV